MSSKLKRELTLVEVICISSGVMISSGLFVLPAIAYAQTGASMILSYAIGCIIILPSVLAKAELTSAMPKTGGAYFFISRSMGPAMGMIGGFTAWIALALKSAFSLLAMGIFVILLVPDITILQTKLIAVGCCLFFTVINVIGVKFSGRFQVVIVILLILSLLMYVFLGSFHVDFSRYTPFMGKGIDSVFATAGLIFISYAGLTKIAAIAEEVKDPGRNLPLAMFYSWGMVFILYVFVVFITVGILDANELINTLTPISNGGGVILGRFGIVVMSIAALLAFVSTGNAGILAASRNPLAMGKEELLPDSMGKLSERGTPIVSILVTSAIMILSILFLDLETFVKIASAIQLLLFILENISLIFMREGNVQHYRPTYKAPLYPWLQIIGILGYGFLLIEMGKFPLIMLCVFVVCSLLWYYIFSYGRIKREHAILHIVERIAGIKSSDYMLDEELRDIIIERDNITVKRFENLIENCPIIDLEKSLPVYSISKMIAESLSEQLNIRYGRLLKLLLDREKDPEVVISSGVACISICIPGHSKFNTMLVRDKEGISFSDRSSPVNFAFVIVYTSDEYVFNLHVLSWIVEMIKGSDCEKKCKECKNSEQIRETILSSWREGKM